MNIENIEVYGFRRSFHGMRNPFDSWDKSDTRYSHLFLNNNSWVINAPDSPDMGPNDIKLACKLIKAGTDHRKFLRQIQIWIDITIPIYVWSEFDTYKVATVRNSCSTMHTLGLRDLDQQDFEDGVDEEYLRNILDEHSEKFRIAKKYKNSKRMKEIKREYKNDLPSGFLQKATYTMSYETALSMYFARRNHALPEWNDDNPKSICSFIKSLPYMEDFIKAAEKKEE